MSRASARRRSRAREAGREVVVVGRAMERIAQVARETGYLDGIEEFRSVEAYGYLPPDKVLALCTGSQGEPRAALARIAEDQHPDVTLGKGDTRDLLVPHHSGQREGGRARHQRADPPGHRGHHRPHPPRPRLRPSAARRDGGDVRLGEAAGGGAGARRGAASLRACRARAPARRAGSGGDRERRRGAARARPVEHRRRGAGGAALQGRQPDRRSLRPAGARPQAARVCWHDFHCASP